MFKIRQSKYRHVFCDQPKNDVRLRRFDLNDLMLCFFSYIRPSRHDLDLHVRKSRAPRVSVHRQTSQDLLSALSYLSLLFSLYDLLGYLLIFFGGFYLGSLALIIRLRTDWNVVNFRMFSPFAVGIFFIVVVLHGIPCSNRHWWTTIHQSFY